MSGARIDARSYAPPEPLAEVVERLWEGRWDLRGQPAHVTHLLSDPCVHIVFEHGAAGRQARVVGVWTRLWKRRLEGQGHVRGVKLRAGAVKGFLDGPAHALVHRMVPLVELIPELPDGLVDAVLDPPGSASDEAFAPLLAFLQRIRRSSNPVVAQAVALVDLVRARPEITSAEVLADHAGVGVRGLQRIFREHVGATPKWVIRRNRLQEAAQQLESGAAIGLAHVAATLGYTDQAHFTRDFRAATGVTPGRFAVEVHR